MNQQQLYMMLQGAQPEEIMLIENLIKDLTEEQRQQFVAFYQGKRKDSQNLLIMTLLGFLGIAGIQRFIIGEIGMGILYLLTGGLCGIGTIIDLINIKKMTSTFNQKQAIETLNLIKMMSSK
ncbi:MAG: NINE protein [Bacteroidia bacterium]